MEDKATPEKRKWRPNLFDIIFIVIILVIAWFVVSNLRSPSGGVFIAAATEPVTFTVELNDMFGDSAFLVKPGDALVDYIERRNMGTVVSVIVEPSVRLEKNDLTGARVISDYPGRFTAIITVRADATVTDTHITIPGGFIVRVGTRVTVTGPLYNGSGYITHLERSDAS